MPAHFLYRYLSLRTPRDRVRARTTLASHRLWFASPAQYNDPAEFLFRVRLPASVEAWRAMLARRPELGLRPVSELSDEAVKAVAARFALRGPAILNSVRDTILAESAICCFAGSYRHPLLWAHYADGHRGICLEFRSNGPTSVVGLSNRVRYSHRTPVIDLDTRDLGAAGRLVALTKGSHWSYERESRIVDSDHGAGYRRFGANEITRVFLGVRVGAHTEELVRNWLVRQPRVEVARIRWCAGRYALRVAGAPDTGRAA
jgi:hypothetical protein